MKTPFPYQRTAIDWALPLDHIPLFMQQRLGKSFVFLRWAKHKLESCKHKRVLIVCPLSVINSWEKELIDEGIAGVYLRSDVAKKPIWEVYKQASKLLPQFYCVTNYESLLSTDLLSWGWDIVCLDESTRIRRVENKITAKIINETRNVKHRAVLSGKPAPESLLDYYNQMKFLHDSFLGVHDFWNFKVKYFPNFNKQMPPSKFTKQAIESAIERLAFTLKREDVDIGSHTFLQQRTVEMSDDFREIYDQIEKNAFARITDLGDSGKQKDIMANWHLVAQNYLQQLSGGCPKFLRMRDDSKMMELRNLISGELQGEKIVIWARYRAEIEYITQELREDGHNALMIYGSTPLEDRGKFIDLFQKGTLKDCPFLVCQIKTAQQGLDLSASSTAIYWSNSWENEHRAQSIDRIIHPSKRSPCLAIDLVSANSIDSDILLALEAKNNATEFTGNIFKNFMARMTARQNELAVL